MPIKARQQELAEKFGYKPVFVKIAPDMTDDETQSVADTLVECGIDGVIATNTTLSREAVKGHRFADEAGGLSGAPVRDLSTHTVKTLSEALNGRLPVIGVGGILKGADAVEKINAGASLVQVYSGFIYRGPELVAESVKAIAQR